MTVSLSPTLSRREALSSILSRKTGEEANENGAFQFLRARGQTIRYANLKIRNPS
jgi:hypothetical protein